MRRTGFACLWLLAAVGIGAAAPAWAGAPKGFEDVFNGVEKGKKFHSLWPPAAHRSIVGVMVSAKDADKIMATWESVESPTFLNPAVAFKFEKGALAYAAPDLTQVRTIEVGLGFAELDALAAVAAPTAPAPGTEKKETGIDVSLFKEVKRSISGISVEYYTLGTLQGLDDVLTNEGKAFLAPEGRGWIVHRCLRLDGLNYTVTTKNDVSMGLFAKIVSWLPTVDVRYENSRTLRLVTNYPIYIGYKLWRPGMDVLGRGTSDVDVQMLGLDADEIDQKASAARAGVP